jgi:hypothetical protein
MEFPPTGIARGAHVASVGSDGDGLVPGRAAFLFMTADIELIT